MNTTIQRIQPGPRMSRAVVHNGTIYFSGLVADHLQEDVSGQMRNILAKIEATLADLGSDKSRILSATILLPDIGDYDAMNAIWDAWVVPGHTPARATLEARLAKPEFRIEIMVIAAL